MHVKPFGSLLFILVWMQTGNSVGAQDCQLASFLSSRHYDSNFDTTGLKASYPLGSAVRVPCNVGFVGFFKLLCLLTGWDHQGSKCERQREKGCPAPAVEGGFFTPEKETYPHGATIHYRCEQGRKPNVEGWWATSSCQNGNWTPTPQCIDVNDCLGPEIPNAQYTPPRRSYKDGETIRIKCDEGYKIGDDIATATCRQGNWTSLPICYRDVFGCPQPDKTGLPHAVIMHEYQTIFPDQKTLLYECKKGYSVAQGKSKSITCALGLWDLAAPCNRDSAPGVSTPTGTGHALVPTVTESTRLLDETCRICVHVPTLKGQREETDCPAPKLEGGFVAPEKETYPHGATIHYRCEYRHKPNAEGWWATSSCQNGNWTQKPQCIDENDCLNPKIPNAQYPPPPYENGKKIRIKCDEGYTLSGIVTTTCRQGNWTSPPVCERDINACPQPDEIPHAVIMHEYQTMFPDGRNVSYQCEKGYSVTQGKNKSIVCSRGQWYEIESCVKCPIRFRTLLEISPEENIYEGDMLSISCRVMDSECHSTTYNHNNLLLLQGNNLLGHGHTKITHSMIVLAKHSGDFECRLYMGNIAKVSTKNVSVTELFSEPTLTMSPAEVFYEDKMNLTCKSQSYASERLRQEDITYTIESRLSQQREVGVFSGRAPPYSLNYSCTARANGILKYSNTLIVRPKECPIRTLLEISPEENIYEGDMLSISCRVMDSECHSTTYNHNNLLLLQGNSLLAHGHTKITHSMIVLAKHSGDFECRLYMGNIAKVSTKTVSVTELFSEPTLTMSPAEVFYEDKMNLTCKSQSYASERLRQEDIKYTIEPPESRLSQQREVGVFSGRAPPYSLNYSCTARAKGILKYSNTLIVRPKECPIRTLLEISPEENVYEGDMLSISCRVMDSECHSTTYNHNNLLLLQGNNLLGHGHTKITHSMIVLAKHSGDFECRLYMGNIAKVSTKTVSVTELFSEPTLTMSPAEVFYEGKMNLTCKSQSYASERLRQEDITYTIEPPESRLSQQREVGVFSGRAPPYSLNYSCTARAKGILKYSNTLIVRPKECPIRTLLEISPEENVYEGDMLSISCRVMDSECHSTTYNHNNLLLLQGNNLLGHGHTKITHSMIVLAKHSGDFECRLYMGNIAKVSTKTVSVTELFSEPTLTMSPAEVFYEGKMNLTCKSQSYASERLRQEDITYTIEPPESRLSQQREVGVFSGRAPPYSLNYSCTARAKGILKYSNTLIVRPKECPIRTLLEISPEENVYEGDMLSISCRVMDSECHSTTYNHNNLLLLQGNNLLGHGHTKITHSMIVLAKHSGDFECRLYMGNIAKVSTKTVSVTELFSEPTLTMSPAEVFYEDKMNLTCKSQSYASERLRQEDITYTIDSRLSQQREVGVFSGRAPPYSLNYSCTARAKGILKYSNTLIVRPKECPIRTLLEISPEENVYEGDMLSISCRVMDSECHSTTYNHNNLLLLQENNLLGHGHTKITHSMIVLAKHSGDFECRLYMGNIAKVSTKTVSVTELFSEPMLTMSPAEVFYEDKMNLTCKSQSYASERLRQEDITYTIEPPECRLSQQREVGVFSGRAPPYSLNYSCTARANGILKYSNTLIVRPKGQTDCPAPKLEGGFFAPEKETYAHGATVHYKCDYRHKPNAEGWWATSTCQDGNWTQTPQCIDVNDCLNPKIPNAQYPPPPYENGKRIRIKCDEGYTLSGSVSTTCRDGNWTSPPICERNACPQPDEIPHAVIMYEYQTMFPDGKNVSYQCEKGYYVAQGKGKSIVCSRGQWYEIESCVTCSSYLGIKYNTKLVTDDQLTASSVYSTSFPAYKARLGNGNSWFPATYDQRQWLQVDLKHSKTITGIITQGGGGYKYYVKSFKVSHSDDGRSWTVIKEANGSDKIFTGNHEENLFKENLFESPITRRFVRVHPWTWYNGIALRIELLGCVPCDRPGDAEHAKWKLVEGYDFVFGSEVEYTCRPGYQLVRGSSKRRCKSNGWDGEAPVCQLSTVRCGRPGDAEHAEWQLVEGEDYVFGSEVEYTCRPGYQLVRGSSKRRCKSHGWDGAAPVCQLSTVRCGRPGDAEHAEWQLVAGEDYVFGSEVEYTCHPDYQVVRGSSKRWCTSNGWDGAAPVCQTCSGYLGIKYNVKLVTDDQLTASSVLYAPSTSYSAYKARLDNGYNWSPATNDHLQWLQVDLKRPKTITGIITQGIRNKVGSFYVESFKVSHSDDGRSWTVIKEANGSDKIFTGNHDYNTYKENLFKSPITRRFVRVLPLTWYNWIALRIELLVCDD